MSIDQKPPGPDGPSQWDDDKPTQVGRPALLDVQPSAQPAAPQPPAHQPPAHQPPAHHGEERLSPFRSPINHVPVAEALPPSTTPRAVPAVGEEAEEKTGWVEEGLFFQGPKPPASEEWSERDWIEIPHEHYIPVSKSRLIGALWKSPKAQAAGQHFKHFIELTEAIYHFHYHQTLNELKEDYEYFSPDGGEARRTGLSEKELIWREQRFIGNFVKTMTRGNFIPFSEQDRKNAREQNYLFDLAIDVKWDVYDRKMIEDFLDYVDSDEGENLREELELEEPVREFLQIPEEFQNGVMLFYRGIGRDQASGMFLMQKIDLFLGRFFGMVVWPFQWVIDKIRGHKDEGADLPKGFADMKEGLRGVGKLVGVVDGDDKQVAAPTPQVQEEEEGSRGVIFDRRWVRRVNLGNQKLKFGDLTKISHLQEPALSRVLCLFRLKPPQPPQVLDRVPILKKLVEKMIGKKEVKERDWTMYLKMFKDIPLADSDIVFPEKKVRMKSFDLTMLMITFTIGLAVIIQKGFVNPPKDKTVLVVIILAFFSYAVKLVLGFLRARTKYMSRMTSELYHKSLDNDLGVLQYLVDALEEQEVKEATLAYFFLWNEGRPMTEEELDGRIEAFLHEHFDGLEIDFEVDDALDKVIEKDGPQPHKHLPIVIVREGAGPNGEDLYEAKPLEEALRIMDHKWDNFYEYNT